MKHCELHKLKMIDKYKTDTHHIYTLFCAVCFDSLIDGDFFAELWVMQFFTWLFFFHWWL